MKDLKKRLTTIIPPHNNKEIHRSRLCNLITKQPQNLIVPPLIRHLLRLERGGVIQRKLVSTRPARPRTNRLSHRVQTDGSRARAEVWTCGG